MGLPHIPNMSLGAWIFATGVAVAIIAPAGVYATANTIMAIGNSSGTTTAYVTPTRQLQTAMIAPNNVINFEASALPATCRTVYTPPAGKAIVVTQVTYDAGTGTQGDEAYGYLGSNCSLSDIMDTVQAFESQSHTFPAGLPLANITLYNALGPSNMFVTVTGYLISATDLPPEPPRARGPLKGMVHS